MVSMVILLLQKVLLQNPRQLAYYQKETQGVGFISRDSTNSAD